MVAFHGGLQYAHSMASTFKTVHNGHEQYCMKWKQDGKWRYVYAYTRADLNNKHLKRVAAIGVDGIIKPARRVNKPRVNKNNPSLKMIFNEYLEHTQLANKTYTQRVHEWNNGFKSIENQSVKTVSRETIERIILDKTLPPSTAFHYSSLINAVLNYALKRDYIKVKPALLKPHYENKTEIKNNINIEQYVNDFRGIMRYVEKNEKYQHMYPIIKLMTLGLRIGEILAITREQISDANMTLTINKTLINNNTLKAGTKGRADTYKTRTIPLPMDYYTMLINHIDTLDDHAGLTPVRRDGTIINNEHVIFIKNKHVMTYSYFNWIWHRIQRDYFNEIWNNKLTDDNYLKPHTTRHITASLMAYDGIPLSMAQTILGHMSASMTQHYTHITSNMKRETIERFINDTNVQTMNNIVDLTMKTKNKKEKINQKTRRRELSNAREQS